MRGERADVCACTFRDGFRIMSRLSLRSGNEIEDCFCRGFLSMSRDVAQALPSTNILAISYPGEQSVGCLLPANLSYMTL